MTEKEYEKGARIDASSLVEKLWLQPGMRTFILTDLEKDILGSSIQTLLEQYYISGTEDDEAMEKAYEEGREEGREVAYEEGKSDEEEKTSTLIESLRREFEDNWIPDLRGTIEQAINSACDDMVHRAHNIIQGED